MRRSWVQIGLVVVAALVVVLAALPLLVNVDRFRPMVQDEMSTALGRQVTLGRLSLSVWSGSLVAEQIAIADDPAFSHDPMLRAKALRIGVRLAPLVLGRRLHVTGLTIEEPTIALIESADGRWNFASLGGSQPKPAASQSGSSLPEFRVDELKIVNGTARLSRLGGRQGAFAISGIQTTVKQLSLTEAFPFTVKAVLGGGGQLQVEGKAGPVAQSNAVQTPFEAHLRLQHLDVAAAGGLMAAGGLAGLLDVDAQASSQNGLLHSTGKIRAEHLKLARNGTAAREPVEMDYALTNNLVEHTVTVNDVALHAGSVAAHVQGSYRTAGEATVLDLKLSALGLPIDGLENLLPAAGVELPSGSRLRGGTLTANLTMTGPADGAVVAGPVVVSNTVLAGYDLGAHIGGVNPFGGNGQGTKIETLRVEVRVSEQGEQISNLYAELPQVGTATGGGMVSAKNDLNFQLVAKFNPTTGVGMVLGKGMNAVTGLLGRATHSKAGDGVPVTVQGTASNPQIHAHLGEMFKPQLGGKKKK